MKNRKICAFKVAQFAKVGLGVESLITKLRKDALGATDKDGLLVGSGPRRG